MNIPAKLSTGEELFALHCSIYGIEFVREFAFWEGRKFRFDFWIPRHNGVDCKIAVEIEGGTAFGKSRHSRGQGIENDMKKYNQASLWGIKVFRFTTKMVETGEAIDFVRHALDSMS